MGPAKRLTYTAGEDHLERMGGSVHFDWVKPEHDQKFDCDETFRFHCFMRPSKGIYKKHHAAGTKPPVHFHRYQHEYFEVVGDGDFTVEIEGEHRRLTKEDPPALILPYVNHVVYPTPGVSLDDVEFTVSSVDVRKEGGSSNHQLDRLYFENWYGYQEDVFRTPGAKFDIIQTLSIMDAGDVYLRLPRWVPFRQMVSIFLGIVVGRWIGGLLGYQPYYPEWTTDWDAACALMSKHWTQRGFAEPEAPTRAKQRFIKSGLFNAELS